MEVRRPEDIMQNKGLIYLCPATMLAHWVYLVCAGVVLVAAYVVFMKKYYHLHEEYLTGLREKDSGSSPE